MQPVHINTGPIGQGANALHSLHSCFVHSIQSKYEL